jgi:hypothetical protein
MSERRKRIGDGIDDMGFGAVLLLLTALFVVPAMAALSSEIGRPRDAHPVVFIVFAGGLLLVFFGLRFLVRGLARLFEQ